MDVAVTLLVLTALAALATWQACEIWRHGSIFAAWYASVESRPGLWWCRLLACVFCLSNWVALLVVAALLVGVLWNAWVAVPALALAAARLANLGNDLAHGYCRTPLGPTPRTVENDLEPADNTPAGDAGGETTELRPRDPGASEVFGAGDGSYHS